MAQKIVAGNWKMNGSFALVNAIEEDLIPALNAAKIDAEVIVFPPSVYASSLLACANGVLRVGLQNVSERESGAFTGEISASMLADLGCSHCLVGHSERREMYGDSNQVVADKLAGLISAGVVPVLCVGETLSERESGQAEAVVSAQLESALAQFDEQQKPEIIIAYEPVWAIGTGVTASPEQAQDMHAFIRRQLGEYGFDANAISILYGGSVKAANAEELFGQADIDGGLVGGASLDMVEFEKICKAAR